MKNHTGVKSAAPPKPENEPDDKEQSERFIETARQLGIEENKDAFERGLETIFPENNKLPEVKKNR